MIRQKVLRIVRGTVFVGFFASPAVIPTIRSFFCEKFLSHVQYKNYLPTSVPWKEKPADKSTLTVPTAPLLNAPGEFQ